MTQVVYADILFITNMIISYLLISLVSKIFNAKRNTLRLILASALGGIFSFYILAPEQMFVVTALIKLSFSAAIIFTGFRIRSVKHFFALLLGFYAVSFAFAGLMIAMWILIKPAGMVINNSTVYFNISVPILLLSCAVCYAVIWVTQRVISKRVPQNSICDIAIEAEEKSVLCRGIIDTGNRLSDIFTGWPVIVAEYSKVERLIPYELRPFYLNAGTVPENYSGEFKKRVRTTPYGGVGAKGLLPAFKPDCIFIYRGKKKVKIENVIVAVTNGSINGREYDVLLNADMSADII